MALTKTTENDKIEIVKKWMTGILTGSLIGSLLASNLSGEILIIIFNE